MAKLSRQQITDLITEEANRQGIPAEYIPTLVEVVLAESGGNTSIINSNAKTSDNSYGLWQFNFFKGTYNGKQVDLSNRSDISKSDALDPYKSTQVALSKIKAGLDSGQSLYEALSPWSTRDIAMQTANHQGSGEPWDVNPSMGPVSGSDQGSNPLGGYFKDKAKSSAALDRINQQIKDYYDKAGDLSTMSPADYEKWVTGLAQLVGVRNALVQGEQSGSFIQKFLDGVVQNFIEKGVPAAEALTEANRLKDQYNLDVGAVTGPYAMKRQAFGDDAETRVNNWLNAKAKSDSDTAAWRDRSTAYLNAANQANEIFKTVFPFMVSKAGPHELNSMKAGGPMNQLFNRLGMDYTPPEPIGTTEVNPADLVNQALIAAGPQPAPVAAPPEIPLPSSVLGPPPELPTVPQLPKAPSMLDTINMVLGLLKGEQEKSNPYVGGGAASPTMPAMPAGSTSSGEPWGSAVNLPGGSANPGVSGPDFFDLAGLDPWQMGALGATGLSGVLARMLGGGYSLINGLPPNIGARSILPGYNYFGPPVPGARASVNFPNIPAGTLGVPGGGGGGMPPAGSLGAPRGGGGNMPPAGPGSPFFSYLDYRAGRKK